MPTPTRRKGLLPLLLALLCLFFGSCAENPPDYFAYREKIFTAEIRGTRDGKPFTAQISATPNADGAAVSLCYLSPDPLAQITLTAQLGQDGALCGDADISCGSVVQTCRAVSLEGLLAPILRLFDGGEPVSVQKRENRYELILPSDRSLTLSLDGSPLRYADPSLSFELVWLETTPIDLSR